MTWTPLPKTAYTVRLRRRGRHPDDRAGLLRASARHRSAVASDGLRRPLREGHAAAQLARPRPTTPARSPPTTFCSTGRRSRRCPRRPAERSCAPSIRAHRPSTACRPSTRRATSARRRRALVVVPTKRPAGLPRALPHWVWDLYDAQHGHGARPAKAPEEAARVVLALGGLARRAVPPEELTAGPSR